MPQLRWQIQGEPIVATPPSNLFLRTRGGGEVGKAHYPHFYPNLNIPLSFLDYFSPNDQIDKLPIHLKYFCGDAAERTEAQARQQRNSDRDGGGGNGRRRRGSRPGGNSGGVDKRGDKRKERPRATPTGTGGAATDDDVAAVGPAVILEETTRGETRERKVTNRRSRLR